MNGGTPRRREPMPTVILRPESASPPADDAALVALVQRIRHGDTDALGRLYDLSLGRVYGIALRVLGQAEDAEEVVSDVFVQVWESASRYCPERGGVLAWLQTLAWSRAVDRRRRNRWRRRECAELHPDDPALAYRPCEDQLVTWLDRLSRVQRLGPALAALSPAQRRVIELAFKEDLSHAEIALRTGLPLGTVKSHARRALAALRSALRDEDEQA